MSERGKMRNAVQHAQKRYVMSSTQLDWGHPDVYLAACATDKQAYAIRCARKDDQRRYVRLQREAIILRKLQGLDGIVTLFDVAESDEEYFLIFPPLEKSLFTFVCHTSGRFTEEATALLLSKLVDILISARRRNVSHLNLKLENIMLTTRDLEPIITDWSCAGEVESQQRLMTARGAHHYMSPELVTKKPFDPEKADVWALGVITYSLVCGHFPFEHYPSRGDDAQTDDTGPLFSIIRRGIFSIPNFVSEELADLLNNMLEHNDRKRFTLKQIRAHPFTSPEGPAT
eukprot:TRINITY_DN132_c1_g2_i1.p2 TRINITY_DN132_c1_g2~~TRINITY_DN132_c1_g2_i1.p2  ORF type:complete len:287 (+),score=85.36 TRINITY_DN132_c1_g2_i1:124-984(+)